MARRTILRPPGDRCQSKSLAPSLRPSPCPTILQAFDEALELLASTRMTQLAEGLGLDLPDPFPRHLEILADLLQRVIGALSDPEPFPQDLSFARRECLQRIVDLSLQFDPNRSLQSSNVFL